MRRLPSRSNDDIGFTLVEVSVVIVVIGILVTLGLVVLLGAKKSASDTAAKARLTQGLKTQKTYYSDSAEYTSDVSTLHAMESSVDFDTYGSQGASVLGRVYVKEATGGTLVMVSRSATGTCFWTRDLNGVTTYAKNDCSGEPQPGDFGPSW